MRLLLLVAGVVGNLIHSSRAGSTTLDSLELFATPLPAHVGVFDLVEGLELRLYLPQNEAIAIRVTPTCAGVRFEPSFALFDESISVVNGIVAQANMTGDLTIDYVATVEGSSSEKAILFSQSVTALPIPTAYAVDTKDWTGVILHKDSFDNTAAASLTSSFWSEQLHGYSSNACGSFDGTNSLLFTSLGDRVALTAPLELAGFHGKMNFYHLYGFEQVQKFDSTGDNRVACEMTDIDEEVLFGYLPHGADPRNTSTWRKILEIPLLSAMGIRSSKFAPYSVILPSVAMHQTAQFYWIQKNHSSFPIDVATGLTRDIVISAENDPTGVHGQLGIEERELWNYRNLFDQWAIDDVELEVRLNVPQFSPVPSATLNSTTGVGVGGIDILVASPVPGSWVAFTSGDGTQAFPDCKGPATSNAATVVLSKSGYVHAVACLMVNDLLVSSYPVRSPLFLVQAVQPSISSTVDKSTSVDTWSVDIKCTNCAFIRYAVAPLAGDNEGTSFVPSCTFGTLISSTSGKVLVTFNAKLRVVACGTDLLPSTLVESNNLVVHPRTPTFKYIIPATTVTGIIDLTIVPPASTTDQYLGVAYSIVTSEKDVPSCSSTLSSGEIKLVVKVFDVVRAVACCVGVVCADSVLETWGPLCVQAEKPTYTTACSAIKPLTLVVDLAAVTTNASTRYQLLSAANPNPSLTCSSGSLYETPVEVGVNTLKMVAVSCMEGLKMSDTTEITIALDTCCSGRTAYLHESCAHVLILQDDFKLCPADGGSGNVQTNTNWHLVTSQWGGTGVNGGVHADNVRCVADAALGKNVLELTANGDIFDGVLPVGKTMTTDGSLRDRTVDDRFMEWALDGINPLPCNPLEHCPARRVGAAVKSVLQQNSGVIVIRMKPCSAFGTLTQVWWGSYEDVDTATTSAEREIPFLPLWRSALYQAKTTPDVPFTLTSPQPTDDTAYTEIVMQWDASAARTNLYVDGRLVLKQKGMEAIGLQSEASSSLSIGVWFPNTVAGEPFFSSCKTYVDNVQIFDKQITSGRWCDFEDVNANVLPCSEDADCKEWVRVNCFMDIYEAVCTDHRVSDIDDSSSSSSPAKFCQFRLQPTAQTGVSSTSTSNREQEMHWEEDEEPKQA